MVTLNIFMDVKRSNYNFKCLKGKTLQKYF